MDNGTSVIIDLASRYAAAFGIVKASEMMSAVSVTKEDNQYQLDFFDDFDEQDEEVKIVYDKTVISFGSMLFGESTNIFAPPMIMDFDRDKNLIETETNGEDNVIVERWGTKPWEISMRGLLIDVEKRKYPSEKIRDLHRLFKINDKLEVFGKQFVEKDIFYIYFKNVSIRALEGFGDTVQFNFIASAIKESTWTLKEPNK